MSGLYCPKCGEPVEQLHEGYCEDCCEDGFREAALFVAEHKRWHGLTDDQRAAEIKRAGRLGAS